ncbi:MAG: hypothetical protein L0Y64_19720 [Myxococcaceae bacterium]|nr:hypothetical protein [Myxococcaceae bacterium]
MTVLRGARLIDGKGGRPIEDATLVLEGQRLRAVGPSAEVVVPPSAKVLELAGKTILPGLVSNHSHLGMVDGTSAGSGNYTRANVSRQVRQFEMYGVTTVTSLGFNRALFYELQKQLSTGRPRGADIFGADRGFEFPSGPHP